MRKLNSNKIFAALICALFCCMANDVFAQAIPVTVGQDKNGNWHMYRNGEVYYIKGVGGNENLEKAVEIGANSFRTWNIDNAGEILDKAQSLGLTVMMGLWVQHERHGFDYNNTEKVQQQLDYFRQEVMKYKDHPALLAWGVGNEVDLFYTNTKVWYAVNDIAAMIHEVDPNHPTVTVTAGYDTTETRLIMERAPNIDIYGINTYGDIGIVYDNIRTTKWDKPYIIAEWGPNGHWEVQKTTWGAPVEQSSSEKALSYKNRYLNSIERDSEKCIGSYVFLWGQKQETTSTWYGLFDEKGASSQAIDELQRLWTKQEPDNVAPVMNSLTLNEMNKGDAILLQPDNKYFAVADVYDADNDKLKYHYEIISESQDIKAGGDAESRPPSVKGLAMHKKKNTLQFRAPMQEGAYRLFFYAYDGNNHYAYQNIPFYVLPAGEGDEGRLVTFKKATLE